MNLEFAMAVLAASAGLANVFTFGARVPANRFAISDLRPPDACLHAEFAQHTIHNNFKVQFAHAGNQSLSGVRVGVYAEGGIFLRKLLKGVAELILIRLGLRLDGYRNDRSREFDGFQNDWLLFVAKCVSRSHALQTYAGGNIARIDCVDFLTLVCMHAQEPADAFAGAFRRVVDIAAGLQDSRIHTDVSHMPDKRVGHNLERQRRKRLVVAGPPAKGLRATERSAL